MKKVLILISALAGVIINVRWISQVLLTPNDDELEIPAQRLHPTLQSYFKSSNLMPEEGRTHVPDLTAFGMLCEPDPEGTIPAIDASLALIREDIKSKKQRIIILLLISTYTTRNPQALADHVRDKLKVYIESGHVRIILTPNELFTDSAKNYAYSEMALGETMTLLERYRRINLCIAYLMAYVVELGYNFVLYDDSLRPRAGAIGTILERTSGSSPNVLSMDFGSDFFGRWYSAKHLKNLSWYLYNLPHITDLPQALFMYKFCSFSTSVIKEQKLFTVENNLRTMNFNSTVKTHIELKTPKLVTGPTSYKDLFWLKYPRENDTLNFVLANPKVLRKIQVISGLNKYLKDSFSYAILETSYDQYCKEFTLLSTFDTGEVLHTCTSVKTTYCIRLKITKGQKHWVAIRYIHIT